MKMNCVYGWDCSHPELVDKVERFISTWRETEDNASYSNATFFGIIDRKDDQFREMEENEQINYKNIRYHIQCDLLRAGAEVRVTLLWY